MTATNANIKKQQTNPNAVTDNAPNKDQIKANLDKLPKSVSDVYSQTNVDAYAKSYVQGAAAENANALKTNTNADLISGNEARAGIVSSLLAANISAEGIQKALESVPQTDAPLVANEGEALSSSIDTANNQAQETAKASIEAQKQQAAENLAGQRSYKD